MPGQDKKYYNFAIEQLSPDDFQRLCWLFLQDKGYICRLGPIPGNDFAHDLYGSYNGQPFIGHCTTTAQRSKLKAKLEDDMKNGIRQAQKHGLIYPEIYFFSVKSAFSPTEEPSFIKTKLLSKAAAEEPTYCDHPPKISITYGHEIAEEISLLQQPSQARNFLKNILVKSLDLDSTDLDLETEPTPAPDLTEISRAIKNFSTSPPQLQIPHLIMIVAFTKTSLYFSPEIAQHLMETMQDECSEVTFFLKPLCKSVLGNTLTETEICNFFNSLRSSSFSDLSGITNDHWIVASRFFRSLIYQRDPALNSKAAIDSFQQLFQTKNLFWAPFLVDISFRYQCGYISTSQELISLIRPTAEIYFQENPTRPLTLLEPFIQDPLAATKSRSKKDLLENLRAIASSCESVIEARWCLSSAYRLLPLFSGDEEEEDLALEVESIIGSFPETVVMKSPHIQFKRLSTLLKRFLYRKEPMYLAEYEQRFIKARMLLLPPQALSLQLEYAASLVTFCQFYPTKELNKLSFGVLLASNKNIFSHPLFSNSAWANKLPAKELKTSRDILTALRTYITAGFRSYAKLILQGQHLRLLDFPSLKRIYWLRAAIGDALKKSLYTFNSLPQEQIMPAFFARSTAVFSSLDRKKNHDILSTYTSRAITAEPHDVIRNAKHICSALYTLYHYPQTIESTSAVSAAANKVFEVFTLHNVTPGLHWAYLAGIRFDKLLIEKKFVVELGMDIIKTANQISDLLTREEADLSLVISSDTLDIISSYRMQGSLFATALMQDLQDPEIWNLAATTVFNKRPDNSALALAIAAQLYAIAKCCAHHRKLDEQKYSYNFIRCRASSLLISKQLPGPFLLNTAAYLTRSNSEFFAYKEECLVPFFDLLDESEYILSREDITEIRMLLERVHWLQRK
jgi:hypothetical protein